MVLLGQSLFGVRHYDWSVHIVQAYVDQQGEPLSSAGIDELELDRNMRLFYRRNEWAQQ